MGLKALGMPRFSATPGKPDTAEIGNRHYGEIFSETTLPENQATIVRTFDTITGSRDLKGLDAWLKVLSSPDYHNLANNKLRRRHYTPFVQLFLNLNTGDRKRLLNALHKTVQQPANGYAMQNALEALADIYFVALRPGGLAYSGLEGNLIAGNRQDALNVHLRGIFGKIVNNRGIPPEAGRLLKERLRADLREIHWQPYELVPSRSKKIIADIRAQIMPFILITHPIASLRPAVAPDLVAELEAALLSEDNAVLRKMSDTGRLAQALPEWKRLTGPENTQHGFHDFTLDEHTLRVVERTRTSPYYRQLSPKEKRLVTMAALLHDISKDTGQAHLREHLRPDRHHPYKSASTVREILPSLGYDARDTERIAVLIEYHQLFGSMIITNKGRPPEEILQTAAVRLRSLSMLKMLRALSEGDIRGVKAEDRLFDQDVQHRLGWYAGLVEEKVRDHQAHAVFLPQSDVDQIIHRAFRADQPLVESQTLDALLKRLSDPAVTTGFSREGGIPAVKIPASSPHHWVTTPFPQPGQPLDIGWGDHDEPIHKFYYRRSGFFRPEDPKTGIIVDLLPENILVSDIRKLHYGPEILKDLENPFLKIVSGQTDHQALENLRERRLAQADYYEHVASYGGFKSWLEAYESLWPHNFIERLPFGLDDIGHQLRDYHLGNGYPFNETLAIRPLIKGVYYRQEKKNEPIRLDARVREFLTSRRVPLVIVRPE